MQDLEADLEPAPIEPATERADDVGGAGVALVAALTLSACGGGGGGSPSPSPAPPPPPPPVSKAATDAEAARFLLQAQFSADATDITTLKTDGYLAWLNARYSAALGQTGVAWLNARGHNSITSEQRYFWPQFGDFMIWNQLLAGPDQMRKRVALALSEFFVVSLSPIDGFYPPYVIGAYWDVLTANAFGNFRTLLEQVTLNAGMGFFLNTKGNLKEDANGRQPDENYAREVMQLFTIGLYELNPDGTHKLDANSRPIETYGQSDITNLARVFTGYDWDYLANGGGFTNVAWHDYDVPSTHFATNPMWFNPNAHSTLEVNFLGTNIPADTPGREALRIALDRLFNHPNAGPFFARQMIQRLVTSNPSPAYVGRVAAAFANNGSGTRGDLRAVWTAILMDEEARTAPSATNMLSGKLREPVVRFVQWWRTVGVSSTNGALRDLRSVAGSDTALGPESRCVPRRYSISSDPATSRPTPRSRPPTSRRRNSSCSMRRPRPGYINFLQWVTRGGYNDVKPTYTDLLPIAHDVPQVVDWLNLRLTANQMSTDSLTVIRNMLTLFGITATSSNDDKLNMLATGCFLFLISPEYLVQK